MWEINYFFVDKISANNLIFLSGLLITLLSPPFLRKIIRHEGSLESLRAFQPITALQRLINCVLDSVITILFPLSRFLLLLFGFLRTFCCQKGVLHNPSLLQFCLFMYLLLVHCCKKSYCLSTLLHTIGGKCNKHVSLPLNCKPTICIAANSRKKRGFAGDF